MAARGNRFDFRVQKYTSAAAAGAQQVTSRVRAVGIRVNNRVLGGLLMHQTRLSQLDQAAGGPWALGRCGGRFEPLDPLCDYVLSTEAQREIAGLAADSVGHTGPEPVGRDPVMVNTSSMYNPYVAAYPHNWYNTSSGAWEMSPTGVPYGFFYEPLEGHPEGYPLLVEINDSQERVSQLWAIIQQGHYLYSVYSLTLVVRLAAFNVGMRAIAMWTGSFSWPRSGGIHATFVLQVRP